MGPKEHAAIAVLITAWIALLIADWQFAIGLTAFCLAAWAMLTLCVYWSP